MLLRGRDGSEFEIAIVDWGGSTKAYPDEGPPRWVDVRSKVSTPTVGWTFGGECLDDEEVEALSSWLQAVADRAEVESKIEFAEPYFSFHIVDSSENGVNLRIYLELRGRPPWSPSIEAPRRDVWIDLEVSRHDLRNAASALKEETSRLPPLETLRSGRK